MCCRMHRVSRIMYPGKRCHEIWYKLLLMPWKFKTSQHGFTYWVYLVRLTNIYVTNVSPYYALMRSSDKDYSISRPTLSVLEHMGKLYSMGKQSILRHQCTTIQLLTQRNILSPAWRSTVSLVRWFANVILYCGYAVYSNTSQHL